MLTVRRWLGHTGRHLQPGVRSCTRSHTARACEAAPRRASWPRPLQPGVRSGTRSHRARACEAARASWPRPHWHGRVTSAAGPAAGSRWPGRHRRARRVPGRDASARPADFSRDFQVSCTTMATVPLAFKFRLPVAVGLGAAEAASAAHQSPQIALRNHRRLGPQDPPRHRASVTVLIAAAAAGRLGTTRQDRCRRHADGAGLPLAGPATQRRLVVVAAHRAP